MENTDLISGDVEQYLESLPSRELHRLYAEPSTALAIFRLLPELAKLHVLRLLYIGDAPPVAHIQQWRAAGASDAQFERAMLSMRKLHLYRERAGTFVLEGGFKGSLRDALTGGGASRASFGVAVGERAGQRRTATFAKLDAYAKDRWEAILHFMVGSQAKVSARGNLLTLLEGANLMARVDAARALTTKNLQITQKGFQFLLHDVKTQIWAFLLKYADIAADVDKVEVLAFFFQLGSMSLGQAYSVADLKPSQQQLLPDLADFGVVYLDPARPDAFYPTRLATTLTTGSALTIETAQEGFIIVETNYRIYAYTDSSLQMSILSLFAELRARFPNMVVGNITRESVKRALQKGITSDQIVAYLNANAHPHLRLKDPILPITIIDQITLWEKERKRLSVAHGYLYKEFVSDDVFGMAHRFASDRHLALAHSTQARWMVVATDGHQTVKEFIKAKLSD